MLQPTREQIRRRPFAANPSLITDADSAYIAAQMATTIPAEQRLHGYRPGAVPTLSAHGDNVRNAKRRADLRKLILRNMQAGQEYITQDVLAWSGVSKDVCRNTITTLIASGHLRGLSRTGRLRFALAEKKASRITERKPIARAVQA